MVWGCRFAFGTGLFLGIGLVLGAARSEAATVPPVPDLEGVPPLETLTPAPDAAGPAVTVLPAPADAGPTIRPGAYLSDSVILRLNPDGVFDMRSLTGGRQASGHYAIAPGTLTLLDATGDVGRTPFPLTCRVLPTALGFAVLLGQPQCRQFDGISFRLAS